MRKLVVLLAALAATLVSAPAAAQTLDRVLGAVSGLTAYGYNSCSYVRGSLGNASCQANRAVNVFDRLRQSEQRADQRRRQEFDRRTRQLTALQRACKAGDQQSCARSGGADGQQMEIARALMEACTSGDRSSCRRAEAMMDERNVASYAPQYGQPREYAYAPAYRDTPAYRQAPDYRAETVRTTPVFRRSGDTYASATTRGTATAGRTVTLTNYDPARSERQNCQPAIDPKTGRRIADRFDCR